MACTNCIHYSRPTCNEQGTVLRWDCYLDNKEDECTDFEEYDYNEPPWLGGE